MSREWNQAKTCRFCGARIRWCLTENGKRMPLDFEPADNGNIRLLRVGSERVARYLSPEQAESHRIIAEVREEEPQLYLSHFATRPDCHPARRARSGAQGAEC